MSGRNDPLPDPAAAVPALATPLVRWSWDPGSGATLEAGAGLGALTGLSPAQLAAGVAAWRRLVHPQDVEVVWAADEALHRGEDFHAEYRLQGPQGAPRWVSHHARVEPGRVLVTLADMTAQRAAQEALRLAHEALQADLLERTQALALANTQLSCEVAERRATEAQVRELLGQLVGAEEDERRRLARELHDSLGQHLAALTLGLQAAQDDAATPAALRARLGQLLAVARRLDEDIDRLTAELRPTVLDDLGLAEAVRALVLAWSEHEGSPAVELHLRGLHGRRFAPLVETTAYRVVQEALTNVRKHARAAHVGVIVELREGELRAIVEDDGGSFDTTAAASGPAAPGRRLGLRGMAERAALAGGRLEVETQAGQGTTVYLTVPLPAPDEGDDA